MAGRSHPTHLEAVSRNRRLDRAPPGATVVRLVVAPALGLSRLRTFPRCLARCRNVTKIAGGEVGECEEFVTKCCWRQQAGLGTRLVGNVSVPRLERGKGASRGARGVRAGVANPVPRSLVTSATPVGAACSRDAVPQIAERPNRGATRLPRVRVEPGRRSAGAAVRTGRRVCTLSLRPAPSYSTRIGATLKTSSRLVTPSATFMAPPMRRGLRPCW